MISQTFESLLLSTVITFLILGFLRFVYKLVLKPYWLVRFYRNQGSECIFFPGIGFGKTNYESLVKNRDCFYYEKVMAMTKPETRTWATNLGKNVILHLLDPSLLHEFYKLQGTDVSLYSRDLDFWWVFLETTGHNVSFLEGNAWKRHRKAIAGYLSTKYIEKISPIIIEKISKKIQSKIGKEGLKTFETTCEITGEIIGFILFGDDYHKINFNGRSFRDFMAELTLRLMTTLTSPANAFVGSWFIKLQVTENHKKLFQMIKIFKTACAEVVSNKINELRTSKSESDDMLSHLARELIENPSESLNVEEIIGMISGMIISGVDTTAQMAGMALFYLNSHPDKKERLRAELSNPGFVMKYDSIISLDYLEAVLKESLRHSSFANKLIFRVAQRDHLIGNIKVKKGTYVTTSFLFNNYCTKYHEDPNSFIPERWINKDARTKISYKKEPMIFIPFSEGNRVCMGRNLAVFEAKVIIAGLVRNFDYCIEELEDKTWDVKFFYGPILDPIIRISNARCEEREDYHELG